MTAKDLKNALLQEAVQGKLVPQIASEGNAQDLLEEIRKERLSHGLDFANAKSGKRKSKNETALAGSNPCDITEEEIPFEIPENWCWCRLGDVIDVRDGTHDTPAYIKSGYPLITSKDFRGDHFDFSKTKYISKQDYVLINQRSKVEVGDILFSMIGGNIGNKIIITTENYFEMAIKNVALFKKNNNVYNVYLFYVLEYYTKAFQNYAVGGAQTFVSLNFIRNYPFPLPPLAEQKRIVAAIEKFMPLIEEYGKKETQLKAINEKIGTLTKKAILQEAVQGKLVPQIAAEGNARDLLEEIRKERLSHGFANSYGICDGKNKKSKSSNLRSKSQIRVTKKEMPEITEDEIPFDIPESWCWCRLGEIGDWKAGSTPSRSNPELYNGNIPWLKTGDLTDGDINEIPECISKKALESCSMRLNPIGSVLIAMYGATIGKLGILKIEATTNQACCACVPYNGIYNKYLFYYLMSQKKDFTEKAEGGAQPNISREKLVVHLLPLPPYEEQKRIVAAIEKMLPLCEKLGE